MTSEEPASLTYADRGEKKLVSGARPAGLAMGECITVAVDVHDRTSVMEPAVGRGKPEDPVFSDGTDGRKRMADHVRGT